MERVSVFHRISDSDGFIVEKDFPVTSTGLDAVTYFFKNAEKYALKIDGLEDYVLLLDLPFKRLRVVQILCKSFILPRFEIVKKTATQESNLKEREVAEIHLMSEILKLVPGVTQYFSTNERFRSYLAKKRVALSNEAAMRFPRYLNFEPAPFCLSPMLVISISINSTNAMSKKLRVSSQISADELTAQAVKKMRTRWPDQFQGDQFLLKVAGFEDFIYGTEEICQFDHIRQCISQDKEVMLSLIEKSDQEEEVKQHASLVDQILRSRQERNVDLCSSQDQQESLKISIEKCERAGDECLLDQYFCKITFTNGAEQLTDPFVTKAVRIEEDQVLWDEEYISSISTKNLPLGTRLQFSVWKPKMEKRKGSAEQEIECVGWTNVALFDSARSSKSGKMILNLHPGDPLVVDACSQNRQEEKSMVLHIEFQSPSFYKITAVPKSDTVQEPIENVDVVEHILNKHSLSSQSQEEMDTLWRSRYALVHDPRALAKVALSCPWNDDTSVRELYALLQVWAPLGSDQALELLGCKFSDPVVRAHGVTEISKMSDAKILLYLPQLVHVLKFELNHESTLATMLIERALRNRHRIGHFLFWYLRAELYAPNISERHGLMLESYLRGAGRSHRQDLLAQVGVVDSLVAIARKIKTISAQRLERMRDMLEAMRFPSTCRLPLDPRVLVKGLVVEKCRFMVTHLSTRFEFGQFCFCFFLFFQFFGLKIRYGWVFFFFFFFFFFF